MLIGGLPFIVYLALLALVVLAVVRHRGLMRGVRHPVARSVWCPMKDVRVTATLLEEVWDGQRIDVAACSAFSPPTAVTCSKACLRITKRPQPAVASGIPLLF